MCLIYLSKARKTLHEANQPQNIIFPQTMNYLIVLISINYQFIIQMNFNLIASGISCVLNLLKNGFVRYQ